MHKYIYLLWPEAKTDAAELRKLLLDELAPQLDAAGAAGIHMHIADEHVTTPSPAPKPIGTTHFAAQVSIWTDKEDTRSNCETILSAARFTVHGYRVDEWLYSDYGDNPHAKSRDWPDGQRSPGIIAVTLLRKPKRLARDEWMRRWFGWQSPMSEWMQPRTRYVRNVVLEPIIEGSEPIEGIVEEDWPSGEHVTNKKLFYGAKNWWQLLKHMTIMLRSVTRILNLWNITTVMLSEYFVKTPPDAEPSSRPA